MKNIAISFLSLIFTLLISYGNIENHTTHFQPVEEVYADQLPESIMDLQFIHSFSKLPIVFRGAAKNWEAMNWTPESLDARGLKGIEDVMKNTPGSTENIAFGQSIHFSKDNGERTTRAKSYNDQITEVLKDVQFYEKNIYKAITEKDMTLLKDNTNFNPRSYRYKGIYAYHIIAGRKGYQMKEFHNHETAILAEFYGEKIVFLAQPDTDTKRLRHEESLISEYDNLSEDSFSEDLNPLFKIKSNNYSSFQKVLLKPGDILYIPAGWYHKVHYLTPCIGITQFLYLDKMNAGIENY